MDYNPNDPMVGLNPKAIKKLNFGLLSSREVMKMSVCEIKNSNLSGRGSVYDKRMGVVENSDLCSTCNGKNNQCGGHFGHIRLQVFILHPLMVKNILKILNCICMKCSKLLWDKTQLAINGISLNTPPYKRFKKLVKKLKDKSQLKCRDEDCDEIHPTFVMTPEPRVKIWYYYKDKEKKVKLTPEEILEILRKIPDEDLEYLGYKEDNHPKKMVINILPVLPPCDRPYIISDGGKKCDDDLTTKYTQIVNVNNKLADEKVKAKEAEYQKQLNTLEFHIRTLFDNTQGKSRQSNRRPIKCFRQRLSGKSGLVRNNMSGKRTDFSSRTVIGPDPSLELDEVGIPPEIAKTLTFPEPVSKYNIAVLQRLIEEKKANFVIRDGVHFGVNILTKPKMFRLKSSDIVLRNGERLVVKEWEQKHQKPLKITEGDKVLRKVGIKEKDDGKKVIQRKQIDPFKVRKIQLKEGDIVERHLRNGDWVLFNRQPTLHKMSMMAHRVKILPGSTFRLNLSVTTPYNADFDGKLY